jgi:hypothetical protein
MIMGQLCKMAFLGFLMLVMGKMTYFWSMQVPDYDICRSQVTRSGNPGNMLLVVEDSFNGGVEKYDNEAL